MSLFFQFYFATSEVSAILLVICGINRLVASIKYNLAQFPYLISSESYHINHKLSLLYNFNYKLSFLPIKLIMATWLST
jgi:hypothetical protein